MKQARSAMNQAELFTIHIQSVSKAGSRHNHVVWDRIGRQENGQGQRQSCKTIVQTVKVISTPRVQIHTNRHQSQEMETYSNHSLSKKGGEFCQCGCMGPHNAFAYVFMKHYQFYTVLHTHISHSHLYLIELTI